MSAKVKRLAHAYAVRELRRLGQELTSGQWAEGVPGLGADPEARRARAGVMSAPAAAVLMARAFAAVVGVGLDAVSAAIDDRLAELLR